jgi:CheY-like chemotaxis protein
VALGREVVVQAKPVKVVVVDDNEDALDTLVLYLNRIGHSAVAVGDPFKAEAAVEQFQPDIVFLDIAMPGLDGWELARRLRQKYAEDQLKLVAITAYGAESDRANSRKSGFDAHIVKPADLDMVESILRQFFA